VAPGTEELALMTTLVAQTRLPPVAATSGGTQASTPSARETSPYDKKNRRGKIRILYLFRSNKRFICIGLVYVGVRIRVTM